MPSLRTSELESSQKLVTRPLFRPDIEGLRAIGIFLVVAYHAGIPGFSGGYVGVDVFFVLSGYLITWLLVHEAEETGTIDLIRFYSRRARRLLPALAVMLFIVIILGVVLYAPVEQKSPAHSAIATSAYMSNAYFALTAIDYLGAPPDTNPLLHTWSLSVEEQFYLVWPLFLMFALGILSKRQRKPLRRQHLVAWMLLMTFASLALSLFLTNVRQPWAFFFSPTRAWEFSIGALGILFSVKMETQNATRPRGLLATAELASWCGVGGIIASAYFFDSTTQFPGVAALLPTLSTVLALMSHTVNSETSIAKVLKLKVFQEIGRLSYSWYLWHWPVLVFARLFSDDIPLIATIGLLIFSLLLAEASYRWVENPIRHHNLLARTPAYGLVMAAVITACTITIAFSWRQASIAWAHSGEQLRYTLAREDIPIVYENNCHLGFYETEPMIKECTGGSVPSNFTMVLFGDSHAAQWYSALAELASLRGWRLISMTKSACPYVNVTYFHATLKRVYTECDVWRENVFNTIKEIEPDLVIVSSSVGYVFSNAEWLKGADLTLNKLSSLSGNVVILRDSPYPGFDVPICLARRAWRLFSLFADTCSTSKEQATAPIANVEQTEAAEKYENVNLVDLNSYICEDDPCKFEKGDMILYRDNNHLTAKFTLTLLPKLVEQLDIVLNQ